MAELKHILILANSKRPGGYCVAGKLATPLEGGLYDLSQQWIRLVDPRNPNGGVPYGITLCQGKAIRPLDMVKVVITEPCNNLDHPEDWFFDATQKWQKVAEFEKTCLPQLADNPATLWHDRITTNAVGAGFVRQMQPASSSICLIQAIERMNFVFYKTTVSDFTTGQPKTKYIRDLSFNYAGLHHEFSVTDPEFMASIWNRMTETPQYIVIQGSPQHFLCLSLGLEYHGKHYKIGATVFQP